MAEAFQRTGKYLDAYESAAATANVQRSGGQKADAHKSRFTKYHDTGLRRGGRAAGSAVKIGEVFHFERLRAIRVRPAAALTATLTALGILVLLYSQTLAFTWDAGFHLLAAQMINAGKRPYLDFCFPQTPLNVWWMAFWMHLLGQSWRVPQALAALATVGAMILTSTFVFIRFPIPSWRLGAAVATALMFSLSDLVFRFGTIGQSYGICMFLTAAAFRLAIGTPARPGPWRPAAAGCLAGAAAGCTLLGAMAAPALLAWIAIYSRKGSRWLKAAAFVAAAAIPFLPVARLFLLGPRQTWFNVFQYQMAYRHANWGGTAKHDLVQLSGWLDSTQATTLLVLAVASWWFLRSPAWDAARRSEFYLCGWLALAMGAEVALARPTFSRYFVMSAPFLAVLAAAGFYEISTRLRGFQSRPLVPVVLLAVLMSMGAARAILDSGENYRWRDLQKVTARLRQVAPPNAVLYADEPQYFLLHREPPEGMQFSYSRDLDLPAAQAAELHIVSQKIMDKRVQAGAFDAVEVCMDQDTVDRLKLSTLYRQTEEIEYCNLFWDWAGKPRAAGTAIASLPTK